jgi:hypothetical protein
MPRAIEHIRRMRGGAQSHLIRCDDAQYYVVKFQNNPQHTRVLANELLATRLAARLGLPTPPVSVVEVSSELIRDTEELVVELGRGRRPCPPGRQFGAQYPGEPASTQVFDFLPDDQLRGVENLSSFPGMLVFDKWTCNTNGRQAIFLRPPVAGRLRTGAAPAYRALMIDQGFCFNAGEWDFPDAPLRGLYARSLVYQSVRGLDSFDPWLVRLGRLDDEVLGEIGSEIPPEWYDGDYDSLERLLEQLGRRRRCVPDLLLDAKKSHRQPFPNWRRP